MRKVDQERQDERRRQILDAAARCFAREGYRGASMSAICAEAQMSPGHLYHYFDSKEALVRAHADVMMEEAVRRLSDLPEGRGETLRDRMIEIGLAQLDEMSADPARAAFKMELSAEATRNPAVAEVVRLKTAIISEKLAALLRHGQAHEAVGRDVDPDAAARAILSLLYGMMVPPMNDPAVFPVEEKKRIFARTVRDMLEPAAE